MGNNRVVANASGGIVQTNHFYPFGMSFAEGVTSSGQPYKYNGKELDTERGLNLYDYSARLMDPALGRFSTMDPLAEEHYWVSPYSFVQNNPITRIDPTGMLDDWIYNKKIEEYVWDGNVTKPSETPAGYEYVGASLKDVNNHFEDNNLITSIFTNPKFGENRTPWPGEILPADNLTSFEMWLGTPSESIGEGIGKIGANIGYSIANSPYSLFTGQTIGGTPLKSSEKMDAFIDFVPGLISGGLTKTGQVVKTTQKGLQGYNQFVRVSKNQG